LIKLIVIEKMFDIGFANLRKEVADNVPNGFEVTNITKCPGSNNNCFLIKRGEETYRVVDNGNCSISMRGFFASCALSKALARIIEVLTIIS
jgi:hypothetical protein